MAEWLVEQGIGEDRALLVVDGHALAARLRWSGHLEAGEVADAVLVARPRGGTRGRARFPGGEEALVDRLPRDASEGATLRLEIVRPQVGEAARRKLAHARPRDADPRSAPTLAEALDARVVRRFPGDLWEEVLGEARGGIVDFAGGSLHFSPTPAMTLVDVDGTLPSRELALAAVAPLAAAIGRFDIGGLIGVDFPTLPARSERKAVDAALDEALARIEHERTAMNGFGLVQIVTRMERVSLLHRLHGDPAGAAARLLLRRAEDVPGAGAILLTAHPAILARLTPGWLDALARRTGRAIRQEPDPALALDGGFAQALTA